MMFDGWGNYGSGTGVIGGIIMLVFMTAVLIAVVLLIVWLVRQAQVGPGYGTLAAPTYGATPSALDILKDRYARGEIDKAEFEEKKKYLTA